jgi:shikimate kinase
VRTEKKKQAKKAAPLLQPSSGTHTDQPRGAIFLVGFMGAGKSSVGRALGQNLDCEFEDLDDRIERMEGRSIADIFRTSGENEFRRVEREALRQVLRELADDEIRIIGLGGGAFVQAENAALLKRSGALSVFLDAPVEELWRRCTKQADTLDLRRPLLQSTTQFKALFEARRPEYLKASVRVDTGGTTVEAIARQIASAIEAGEFGVKEQEKDVRLKD